MGDILNVLNLERGVFYTIWGLIRRPKKIVEEYLFHDRWKGAHPVRFLVLSTTIAALASYHVIASSDSFTEGFRRGAEMTTGSGDTSSNEVAPFKVDQHQAELGENNRAADQTSIPSQDEQAQIDKL